MKKSVIIRLRGARGDRSQADFSALFGVPQTTYSSWKNGKKEPSFEMLKKIATTCNVSIDWLLGLTDQKSVPQTKPFHRESANESLSCLMAAEDPTPYDAENRAVVSLLERAICSESKVSLLQEELERLQCAHSAEFARLRITHKEELARADAEFARARAAHKEEIEHLRGLIRDITSAAIRPTAPMEDPAGTSGSQAA